MNGKPILITVTGKDSPGITAEITAVLARAGATMLDVEQVVVGSALSLSFLFQLPDDTKPVLKDLLFTAHELGIHLDFQVFPTQQAAMSHPGLRYALTLLSEVLTPASLSEVSSLLASRGWNIDRITSLSESPVNCLELILSAPSPQSAESVGDELVTLANRLGVDVALQAEGLLRRAKRLVVMDMDSTLIRQEIIDELARLHGVAEEVSELTAKAMAGEIDFKKSLRARVALLEGAPISVMADVLNRLELNDGARRFCRVLKKLGFRLAVISGGFYRVVEPIARHLDLDYCFANRLEVRDGKLTGQIDGPIVDAQRKADLLESLAQQEGVGLDQVIAIGDGANDLPMLRLAGLGIAFNAKPSVRRVARTSINQRSLLSILHLLGIRGHEVRELEKSLKEGPVFT